MLKAGLESPGKTYQSGSHAVIIGAGLAGCAIAYTLARQGFICKIYDSGKTSANATSAVPIALYRPYLSIGHSVVNDYFTNAFERLLTELKLTDSALQKSSGLLQLISNAEKWQHGKHWSVESKSSANDLANHTIDSEALYIKQAGVIRPADLCTKWLASSPGIELVINSKIAAINKTGDSWLLFDSENRTIGEGQLLILANGYGVNQFIDQYTFPLTPVRGQISHFKTKQKPKTSDPIIAANGYAIPTTTGYWAGATHQRNSRLNSINAIDDQQNLATLNTLAHWAIPVGMAEKSWAGVRCTTPDRLPLIGGVPDSTFYRQAYRDLHHGRKNQQYPTADFQQGLYVLAGLGSRGATQALYAAECLADIITGTLQTESAILSAIHPARFLLKQLRQRPDDT